MSLEQSSALAAFLLSAIHLMLSFPAYLKLSLLEPVLRYTQIASHVSGCAMYGCWIYFGCLIQSPLLACAMGLGLIKHTTLAIQAFVFPPLRSNHIG